jgi:hypothetical protein
MPFSRTHREAAPVDLLDTESIEHGEHVSPEPLHRIGPCRHARLAMPAPIVSHQAEVLDEWRDLAIPHVQRGAERARQHEHRRSFPPLDLDMDRTAVGVDHSHGFSSRWWLPFAGASVQRPDDAVDESLGNALVAHWFEQLGELADAEIALHLIVLTEHVL